MAAADFFNDSWKATNKEEHSEIQARDIDQRTLLFQARARGYLIRHEVSRLYKDNIAIENNTHLASYHCKRYRNIHTLILPTEYFITNRKATKTRLQTPTPKTTDTENHSHIEIKSISITWGIPLSPGKGNPSV